ncbi:MAG TPA: acetamidase/formamidase family protein [Acetobacteraceae bacterium]|jgi:acetamidase/formamidase|nr:acetamidase/formamidase family protein [Acetobacteraceae bacterium]
MATHRLAPTPETVRWGTFDAAYPPLITINSGDTVVLECVSGGAEVMPPPASGLRVPPALAAIHAANIPRVGGHILTGPVAVAGAQPGDMLEVHIDRIELGADWGYCGFRPLLGTLPEDFPERFLSHIPVDRDRRMALLPWGTELPLAPFFGVMGVAPPPNYGTISTKEPREHGGNLDNKELGEGATLYLPVWVEGANFSAGDGHGVQGDGEVCINALEICLTGTFTLTLHKGGGSRAPLLTYPRAESATHYITMGMNEDLDLAMKQALREMIAFITSRTNLSREQAYQFCSLAVDFHVTQTVNGEKGIHGLLLKGLLF